MKYSTGKGARVKHSTAREWDEMEKERKRSGYQELKHSTGDNPSVKHATGPQFDYKALGKKAEEDKEGEGVRSKVHSKPSLEGDEYLGFYQEFLQKNKREEIKGEEDKKAAKKADEKAVTKKSVKKTIIDYWRR